MRLATLLDRADALSAEVSRELDGTYPNDDRIKLLVAYVDVALEHHAAITLLVRNNRCGSAFALVRVVFDALYRALWVRGCATSADIANIVADTTAAFPNMNALTGAVDQAYGTDGFFAIVKQSGWTAMNDYTHSGLRQLGRRFKGTNVEPTYEQGAIREAVRNTAVFVALLGILLAKTAQRAAESTHIESALSSFIDDSSTPIASS